MSLNILLVDDEVELLETMKDILELKGFDVETATSGQEASNILFSKNDPPKIFDLMVTDIQMANKNGLELIDEINHNNLKIPIMAITGFGDKNIIVELMRKGVVDYIDKPFQKEILVNKIRQISENVIKGKYNSNDSDVYIHNILHHLSEQYNKSKKPFSKTTDSIYPHYSDLLNIPNYRINNNITKNTLATASSNGKKIDIFSICLEDINSRNTDDLSKIQYLFSKKDSCKLNGIQFLRLINEYLNRQKNKANAIFLEADLDENILKVTNASFPRFTFQSHNNSTNNKFVPEGSLLGEFSEINLYTQIFKIYPQDRFYLFSKAFHKKTTDTSEKYFSGIDLLINSYKNTPIEKATQQIYKEFESLSLIKKSDEFFIWGFQIPKMQEANV